MKMKMPRWILYGAVTLSALVLLWLGSHCSAPLPKPEAFADALPPATPSAEKTIFHLPTGFIPRIAAQLAQA